MKLLGKTVVITGGAGGIGAGLAKAFSANGASNIVIADLDGDRVASVAKELGVPGFQCDVTREADIKDLISSVEDDWSILNPNKLVNYDPKKVTGFINVQPISETIVTGIPVQLINKPNDVNVFVNPATVALTIVGGLDQIANILPTDIDVVIDFSLWNSDKQFYSPKINLPEYLIEWKDLSPSNLEILVIKEIN